LAEQFVAASPVVSNDFSVQCQHLVSTFKKRGMPLSDMRREGMMELQISSGGLNDRTGTLAGSIGINRFEGPIRSLPVAKASTPTRLRFFIDGAQKTYPMFCIGHVPIFATLSSTAILERNELGETQLLPGSLRLEHAWIVPEYADEPRIAELCNVIRDIGGTIVDPLSPLDPQSDDYRRASGDYLHLEAKAMQSARARREQLERNLLLDWRREYGDGDAWIVVDGALRAAIPNAVGLVKSFNYQYLEGDEAATLFTLPPKHRTSAFAAVNRWRPTGSTTQPIEIEPANERVLWYLRFWDASGHDARHALVRIETATDFRDPEPIDELSSWLLAERAPRATADARWDTLLYPIHLLEKMLKRRIDTATSSWPGARQR
jgi:hypothetical protein